MGLIQSSKGRFNEVLSDVMTDIRQPVFVDNAVHYAKSEPKSNAKTKITIEAVNADNYEIASERTYAITESESSLLITHTEADGHTLKSDLFSSKGKNAITKLLFGKDKERILTSTTSSTALGLRADIRNMRGSTLKQLGFDDIEVRLGQNVDIGFRTTDLALRVGDAINDSLKAITIGAPITITKMSANRRKNSNTFLAADFNGVNLATALRYISRHDNRIIKFDRYGNLNYVPFNYADVSRTIQANVRFGNKETSPIESVENRITVKGLPLAVNEDLVFTMDDRAKQQGAHDVDIVENTTPLFDASITNLTRAKTVARQILKANATLSGSIRSQGHPNYWELRPGDIVEYDGNRLSVLEARHTLSGLSDFVFLNADSGLEGVLQNIREGSITTSSLTRPDKTNQIMSENFSFFNSMEVVITPTIKVITSNEAGLLIGRNSDRGRLGGNYKTIGMAKDDGVIIEGESQYVG
tara:strand:+ start:1128 stop:2543 length:1416 start_codon:yes stop_codon:yes gene_type:complete